MKELITYLALIVIGFYVFPLFCSEEVVAAYFLTSVNPIICFICSYCYGSVRPYNWWFPVLVVLVFLPALFVHYTLSDWFYAVGYGGVSMLACSLSWIVFKKRKEEEVRTKMESRKKK